MQESVQAALAENNRAMPWDSRGGRVAAWLLRGLGLLLLPDLVLAVAFYLAWRAPRLTGAATPAECRLIMILEGLSIAACALAGVYLRIGMIVFPLIMLGCVAWFMKIGIAGMSLAMAGFVFAIIAAFSDGILAHRGRFGSARENPGHPHRRYDRMLLLYLLTAPLLPVFWLQGNQFKWAIWGTVYFVLLALADTVLRGLIDKIPQGLLRLAHKNLAPEQAKLVGLCLNCAHVQPAIPARPGHMVRCALSATDPSFAEHPATPVSKCAGFRQKTWP